MPLHLTKSRLLLVGIYVFVVGLVWYFTQFTQDKHNVEGFQVSSKYIPTGPIVKSFGTELVDKPKVALKAALFRAIRPDVRRSLPKAFPSNDMKSPEWQKYLDYLAPVQNQGSCGACWAFSSSGMLSDRYSLLSGGKIKIVASPAKMVMCTFDFNALSSGDLEKWWQDRGQSQGFHAKFAKQLKSQIACAGNNLYSACQELYIFGTPSIDCVPYNTMSTNDKDKYNLGKSSDPSNIPNCWDVLGLDMDTCADGKTAARIYRADDIYSLEHNEQDIMQEIYRWGPVAAGFKVYEGFVSKYDGKSIYTGPEKNENVAGGHAIEVVGWGEENDVPFWWIKNSWSPKWGMNGYFRMKRGIVECQLETNVVGIKPEFPGKSVWTSTLDIVEDIDKALRAFPGHNIDPDSLYFTTAVPKIKAGKLEGNLDPIIQTNQLPNGGNYDNFWIADMLSSKLSSFKLNNSSSTHPRNRAWINLIFIFLLVVGTFIILLL